jgi:probable rRNA maturation factor
MTLHIENRQKAVKIDLRRIRRVVYKLQRLLGCTERELSLLFVDDEQIRSINLQYLNRNRPTNVISFSLGEGDCGSINPDILGDIVVSVERAARDAASGGLSLDEEVDFLLIHGLLHLLGYQHEDVDENEVDKMTRKENELFSLLHGYELERC